MIHLALMLIAAFSIVMTTPLSSSLASPTSEETPTVPVTAAIGSPAPDFTGVDSKGVSHKLSDFKGKTVVLEWTNHECPFVRKFYDTQTMQNLQKDATEKGVIWLTVSSSAKDKQGFTTADEANKLMAKEKSNETARIIDADGTIGKLYAASTTPHMYVINAEGALVYQGAIDDQPSASHSTIKDSKNYVKAALDDLAAGQPVQVTTSKPYGCGVKY
jgi:peroxiredoxin